MSEKKYSKEVYEKAFAFENAEIDRNYYEKQLRIGNPLAYYHRDYVIRNYDKAKKELIDQLKKEKIIHLLVPCKLSKRPIAP